MVMTLVGVACSPPPGRIDAGASDAGPVDAGPVDAGPVDAGACGATTWVAPTCAATDLENKLRCIPNLQVTKSTATTPAGYTRFDLVFPQPIDHANPNAGTFPQRLVLLHTSPANPMVLFTNGYELSTRVGEVTRTFQANQLTYEHRYFATSRPATTDWTKLTIRQAAADAHRIAEAFHWLYPAAWVNSGVSKGGMTSVFHRRFHPCDVAATVAYVAPVSFGVADPAYPAFMNMVGGPALASCRTALVDYQRRLLTKRDLLTPTLIGDFTRVGGVDKAFELAVVELFFSFWQYADPLDATSGCAAIPPATATDAALLDFLDLHSPVEALSGTSQLADAEPYYYQAATELGGPAPFEAQLGGLLRFAGANVSTTFAPTGVPLPFDAQAMLDVNQWLAAEAERVLLVYGQLDPWSANTFDLGAPRDSFELFVAGGNHGARIGLLSTADKKTATLALERWLGTPVVVTPMLRAQPDDAPERRR